VQHGISRKLLNTL